MNKIDFHSLDEPTKTSMLEIALGNKGKCIFTSGGMCGEIYVFDQGENVLPRYVCAKIPKPLKNNSTTEVNDRFVKELRAQLSYYHHMFVHWPFDFTEVMGVPVVLFRYWGNDLEKLIHQSSSSKTEKLSIMIYICSGLSHCYKRGLISHQDLKPSNIFIRDIRSQFSELPDLDIYQFALIADFGLANASVTSSVFDGSRPYMAPEQWKKSKLSPNTDVFSLGVIFYELMTGGFHPNGIKLNDHWPKPIEGNSNKWTKPKPWETWANKAEINTEGVPPVDPEIKQLIQKMLSIEPTNRPSIDQVKLALLEIVRIESKESHTQLEFLLGYFDRQVSTESLENQWPYLSEKWEKFQNKFEKQVE